MECERHKFVFENVGELVCILKSIILLNVCLMRVILYCKTRVSNVLASSGRV